MAPTEIESQGFLLKILNPGNLWVKVLARPELCRCVATFWNFKLTVKPRNYAWSYLYNSRVVVRYMRCIQECRPEIYAECRYKPREQSGLAWGAQKTVLKTKSPHNIMHANSALKLPPQSTQKSHKSMPKALPKGSQMEPFGTWGASWTPCKNCITQIAPKWRPRAPQRDPFGIKNRPLNTKRL